MMTGELYFKMARERRVHLDRIFHLQKRVEELERRLNCYPVDMVSAIPPIPIEMQIRLWMEEYGMPWAIFFCFDHKQWVDELDNSYTGSNAVFGVITHVINDARSGEFDDCPVI
ncbi:hypothetical protein ACVV9D_004141 [Escherichia coli]